MKCLDSTLFFVTCFVLVFVLLLIQWGLVNASEGESLSSSFFH